MVQAEKVYFCTMYVRKKHNRSGSTSVVVVSKASGKYKEIKSFGSSISKEGIDSLCEQAATWIRSFGYQQELDFDDRKGKEVEETKRFLSNIDNVLINGTQLHYELTNYQRSQIGVEVVIHKNVNYKNSPLYAKIRADVEKLLKRI